MLLASFQTSEKQKNKQLLQDVFKDEKVKVNDTAHGVGMIMGQIKSTKVLLVLDDVDSESQLGALASNVDWFCSGSRIIITTKDKQVLRALRVKESEVSELKELNPAQSLQLFSWHAFTKKEPLPQNLQTYQRKLQIHYLDFREMHQGVPEPWVPTHPLRV
ncbi:TMV resistance protein [Nymphaea thermarum]|nr:TMV resistance protein [Nymphaea thermarum]